MDKEEQQKALRAAFFSPCTTKEHLRGWISRFLNIDLPDGIVCDDEVHADPSNSSPMDLIWEVYSKLMFQTDWDFQRLMAYASRESYKTLAASIMECLALFHMRRSVAHMAAQEDQAQKCAQYLGAFLSKPILRDFKSTDNKRVIDVLWYEDANRTMFLTPKEYNTGVKLNEIDPADWVERRYYMKIIVATMKGANCIDPSAPVNTPSGHRQAIEIKPGDEVVSFDISTGTPVVNKVLATTESVKNGIRITLSDRRTLVVSEDHRVFTDSGWVVAKDLYVGIKIKTDGFSPPEYSETLHVPEVAHAIDNPYSVLLGTLLGDSSLKWPCYSGGKKYGRACRFSCSHSDAQFDLLDVIAESLNKLGISHRTLDYPARGTGIRSSPGRKLFSKTSEKLNELYALLYGSGKKVVTQQVLDRVDDEALAYWFMDDASGGRSLAKGSVQKAYAYRLASCGFSWSENELIADWFVKQGLECKVEKQSNQSGNGYPIIKFTSDASRKIAKRIDKYIPRQLRHKIVPYGNALQRFCVDCGKETPASTSTRNAGFKHCGCRVFDTQKQGRAHYGKLRENMLDVVSVEYVGKRFFVDLSIDVRSENQKNFYASGMLMHNSEHVPFLCLDELDLAPDKPYKEALMIPCPTEDGKPPFVFMTSTRKFNFGLVQKEIDDAHETGLHVRHWNVIDVTDVCPPERHLPDEPRIKIWYSTETLRALNDAEYQALSTDSQKGFVESEGYAGCVSQCKLYAACRGRLATKQKSKSRKMLKHLSFVTNQFRTFAKDPELAKAQLLCWKPGSAGMIYPFLSRDLHCKTPQQMIEMITGLPAPSTAGKADVIATLKGLGAKFYAGMDFGFTHYFAVTAGALYGNVFYVLHAIAVSELELGQKIDMCKKELLPLDPTIYPDNAYPSDIKSFRNAGFKMISFKKDVHAGIAALRSKIMPSLGASPEIFFLAGDPVVDLLFSHLCKYHWRFNAAGQPTDEPDETDDDLPDSARYLAQNLFGKRLYKDNSSDSKEVEAVRDEYQDRAGKIRQDSWRDAVASMTGSTVAPGESKVIKKGGKFFGVG